MVMVSNSTTVTPTLLLKKLLESETSENENLIEILGLIKPTKGSSSTLTSIIRGLFTKNTKLLALLNEAVSKLDGNGSNEKEVFKQFMNGFILWFEGNGLVMFEKYLEQLNQSSSELASWSQSVSSATFAKPILQCDAYIQFIQKSGSIVRNPFVLEKLIAIERSLKDVSRKYASYTQLHSLNNISFDDVKLVGPRAPNSPQYICSVKGNFEKVSSYFKPSQITERSTNETIFLTENPTNKRIGTTRLKTAQPVELVFLNLDDTGYFDALAILSRPSLNSTVPRSLLYPPFRVNELSMSYDKKTDQITLDVIDFAQQTQSHSVTSSTQIKTLQLSGDGSALAKWFEKLTSIFPSTGEESSPILIESKNLSSSGLGINILSEVYSEPLDAPPTQAKPPFRELIDAPTISPLSQLQHQFESRPTTPQKEKFSEGLQPPAMIHSSSSRKSSVESIQLRKGSIPSVSHSSRKSSFNESSSIPQEPKTKSVRMPSVLYVPSSKPGSISSDSSDDYDHLMNVVNKSLANSKAQTSFSSSSSSASEDNNSSHVKHIKRNTLDLDYLSVGRHDEDRPRSYQAEVLEQTPVSVHNLAMDQLDIDSPKQGTQLSEAFKPAHQEKFASAPNLIHQDDSVADTTNSEDSSKKMYQLGASSAIDITNFGKGHNPSFSVHRGLSDLVDAPVVKEKKSFFGLFKKKQKGKNLVIDATLRAEDNGLQSATSMYSDEISGASMGKTTASTTTVDATKSKLPAPFALPQSTSMQFFQHPSDSTISLNKEETPLSIPQELKNIINDDESIDFYISPSSPKAMKVSKWKAKYGKWEMLTSNENVFMKIVANYTLNKCWLIVFKEEEDREIGEIVDKPILLLSLLGGVTTTSVSALDFQITSINAVTEETMNVIFRCASGGLLNSIASNVDNIMGVLGFNNNKTSRIQSPVSSHGNANGSKSYLSSSTITSSLMDNSLVNNSSTYSSISSHMYSPADVRSMRNNKNPSTTVSPAGSSFPKPSNSLYALDAIEYDDSNILNNPDNTKLLLLNNMKIRLQKNMEDYSQIHNPSSWKILSMNNLSVYMVTENLTGATYYNLAIEGSENYNWLINSEEKFNVIEKIGKAGMVLKLGEGEIFLIECKGKKEFSTLFELF
ncbi:hypothetical protein CAAN1_14S00848 [[Candida] anglica]|uniref:PH-like domain-containing protein n=1 Tax=[Candida] anglica TaxID=148631 RepID=A0ABP0EK61_9ASCO